MAVNSASKNKPDGSTMALAKVLIVDDEPLIRLGLERFLKKEGYLPLSAATGREALGLLEKEADLALVLLDLKLPDSLDGLSLLEIIKNSRPELTVIMISGQSEIQVAVQAMKLGAWDYLEKPIDTARLKELLTSVAQKERASSAGEKETRPASGTDELVLHSSRMRKVYDLMQRLAPKKDITVLLTGEPGTGKNYLAGKLHEMSPRSDFPFLQFSCADRSEQQMELELFGFKPGLAPSGSAAGKGLLARTAGGTILLDEVEKIPFGLQSRILGLLEGKYLPPGGSGPDRRVDVRILAATNKNLQNMAQEKRFRTDLFYLLNTACIEAPPLRERSEDIPLLAEKFLASFARKYDSEIKKVSSEGMAILRHYNWPGNVRQLKNLIEKLVVLSEKSEISAEDISLNLLTQQQAAGDVPAPDAAAGESDNGLSLEAMERKHIKTALKLTGGNQRKAAKLLAISRDTLRYRLKKFGIEP